MKPPFWPNIPRCVELEYPHGCKNLCYKPCGLAINTHTHTRESLKTIKHYNQSDFKNMANSKNSSWLNIFQIRTLRFKKHPIDNFDSFSKL